MQNPDVPWLTGEWPCAIFIRSGLRPLRLNLKKGQKRLKLPGPLAKTSERESDYIDAIAMYFKDADKVDHHTRCVHFENAMEIIYKKYPQDKEAAIFYALALMLRQILQINHIPIKGKQELF